MKHCQGTLEGPCPHNAEIDPGRRSKFCDKCRNRRHNQSRERAERYDEGTIEDARQCRRELPTHKFVDLLARYAT